LTLSFIAAPFWFAFGVFRLIGARSIIDYQDSAGGFRCGILVIARFGVGRFPAIRWGF